MEFLGAIRNKIDKPVYVIIDEYDHFANELLSFKTDMFSDIVSKTGFVRKWYEVLKIGTESIIQRIFTTGVTPITLDSLTSGFNISTDITRDARFNEIGLASGILSTVDTGRAEYKQVHQVSCCHFTNEPLHMEKDMSVVYRWYSA